MFFSILELYSKQKKYQFRKNNFTCYRGCTLHPDEFKAVRENIGGFLQLEGFISTSTDILGSFKFIKDTVIEIRVSLDNFGGEIDWGFASVEDFAIYADEREVIFNPINSFRIVKCLTKKRFKFPGSFVDAEQVVVLEYAGITELMRRHREGGQLTEDESNVVINQLHQQQKAKDIFMGQGYTFYELGYPQMAKEWCENGLDFIEQNQGTISSEFTKKLKFNICALKSKCLDQLPMLRKERNEKQLELEGQMISIKT